MDVVRQLDKLRQDNAYRSRIEVESNDGVYSYIKGKKHLNFCSNDYLGLSSHKELKKTFNEALNKYGTSSSSSQLICGYQKPHKILEEQIAELLGYEKALLFGNGYMANLGIQQALFDKDSMVYIDKLNHASMYDGLKLSGTNYKRYPHLNYSSVLSYSEQHKNYTKFLYSDSVFSMDGDVIDIKNIKSISSKTNSKIILDDAHGFGVIGEKGKGITEFFEKDDRPYLLLITFGKALAGYGAVVCGKTEAIELMIQKSRSLIYTTSLPAALVATASKAISLSIEEPWRRDKLNQSIKYFQKIANENGLDLKKSNTPIQILQIGPNQKTLETSEGLKRKNILAVAIRPPTVAVNTARIRITITAAHEKKHLDELMDALVEINKQ